MMRSHLLARVAPMASGNRQGGRPEFLCLEQAELWPTGPRRCRPWAAGAFAAGFLLSTNAVLAAQTPRVPAGMVPYAHPVYHNGKRLLWHGAWRGRGGAARQVARSIPAREPAVAEAAPRAEPQPQSTKPFSILADPGDSRASRMARDFASVMSAQGAAGRAIVGSTSPGGLDKVSRADLADFAIVTLDALMSSAKTEPDWMRRSPYVVRLAPETLEVIAPRAIKSIGDLEGKAVSFGDPDSATSTSARLLFSRLGVSANPTYEPLPEALAALGAGKRSAVVVLGAGGTRALADFGDADRFHVIAIPWSPALAPVYVPARVASADQPNLVAANETVDTVGEPLALIAIDAAPGTQRADMLGRVARVFFDGYDAFLNDDRDAHWRDVNLAADASWPDAPWPRLAAVQSWLDAKKKSADASLDAFRDSANGAAEAAGGPSAADSDRLYDSLTRWRGLMQ
jgi:hypothetical protein